MEFASVHVIAHTPVGKFTSGKQRIPFDDYEKVKQAYIEMMMNGKAMLIPGEASQSIIPPDVLSQSIIEVCYEPCEAPDALEQAGGLWTPGT